MPTVRNLRVAASGDAPAEEPAPPTIREARERIQEHQRTIEEHEQAVEVLEEYIELVSRLGSLNGSDVGLRRKKNPHHSSMAAKSGAPTGLLEAIRALAPKMPSPFAANDFLPKLHGIQFKGDPKSAVRDAVLSLRKKEVLKLVEIGKGGKPNRYELHK